jgi:uncharacterized protein DUF3224
MQNASGTFSVDSWKEEPYDEAGGAKLSRASLTKTFQGDLEGTSTAELLVAIAQEGSRAYVGIERINGRLNGLEGSFVVQHNATGTRGDDQATVTVVPDSGTEDFTGLSGTITICAEDDGSHSYDFAYKIEPATRSQAAATS